MTGILFVLAVVGLSIWGGLCWLFILAKAARLAIEAEKARREIELMFADLQRRRSEYHESLTAARQGKPAVVAVPDATQETI